jgi:hypothetical protein
MTVRLLDELESALSSGAKPADLIAKLIADSREFHRAQAVKKKKAKTEKTASTTEEKKSCSEGEKKSGCCASKKAA